MPLPRAETEGAAPAMAESSGLLAGPAHGGLVKP